MAAGCRKPEQHLEEDEKIEMLDHPEIEEVEVPLDKKDSQNF